MPDVPTIQLNDGTVMPQHGLGVWQTPPDTTAQVVRWALEAGYRAVDTATIYDNEEGVGAALAGRDDIFVTTKVWNTDQGYDGAMRSFERSARKLRRGVIDLLLIHWPAPRIDRYVETWKALIELKRSGRVRSVGVSNFMPEHLQRVIDETGVVPSVNQIELHPTFQQTELRAFHDRHGIRTECWSPLGQGKLLSNPLIGEIASKHGRTPAQVIIRWHLDNGFIVIPKSVRKERLRENIDVFGFRLDAEDLDQMRGLDDPQGRIGPNPSTAAF